LLQIVVADARQEGMTLLKMHVGAYDRDNDEHCTAAKKMADVDDTVNLRASPAMPPPMEDAHWALGSRISNKTDSWFVERRAFKELGDSDFELFN
jgi:hypothetical protein